MKSNVYKYLQKKTTTLLSFLIVSTISLSSSVGSSTLAGSAFDFAGTGSSLEASGSFGLADFGFTFGVAGMDSSALAVGNERMLLSSSSSSTTSGSIFIPA